MSLAKFPDRMTGNRRCEIINHLKAGTSLSGSATFIPAPVAVELIDELEHSVRIPDANDVLFAVARCEQQHAAECAAKDDPLRSAAAAHEKHVARRHLLSLVGLRSFPSTEPQAIAEVQPFGEKSNNPSYVPAPVPAGDARELAKALTKQQLIDFLATRRQDLGGSVSEHNHRRLLATRTKAELLTQYERIVENEATFSRQVPSGDAVALLKEAHDFFADYSTMNEDWQEERRAECEAMLRKMAALSREGQADQQPGSHS